MGIDEVRDRIAVINKKMDSANLTAVSLTALLKEKEKLTVKLHKAHVNSLGNSKCVYEDACQFLQEASKYAFMYLYDQIEDGTILVEDRYKPVLIGLHHLAIDRFSDQFKESVLRFDSMHLKAEESPLFLREDYMLKLAEDGFLKYHFEMLAGTDEKKRLSLFIPRFFREFPFIKSETDGKLGILGTTGMLPVYHSTYFDQIASLNSSDFKADLGTNQFVYDDGCSFSMVISDISSLKLNMSIRSHQLFSVALGMFTAQNLTLSPKKKPDGYSVRIPVDTYIELLGYDITEKYFLSEEERESERKRIEHVKREAKRAIRKDLDILHNSTIKIKTKSGGTFRYSLCQVTGLDSKYIYVKFGEDIISYLAELPKTQYALWLPQITGRHPNLYRIANKLVTHASMIQNQNFGTDNRLKVKTLMAVTDLPTEKDLRNQKYKGKSELRKWKYRIRLPFEKNMRDLQMMDNGGLISWHYAKPGHADEVISETDVDQIDNLTDYMNLLIVFELADMPKLGNQHLQQGSV